jgi:hypothetical protein
MRQQHVMTDAHQSAAILGYGRQLRGRNRTRPLQQKAPLVFVVGSCECLHHLRDRCMASVSEGDRNGELTVRRNIDLPHYSDITVQRLAKLPSHLHVGAQVLIAVAGPDVAAR